MDREVYEVSLIGDGVEEYPIELIDSDRENGYFSFEFEVDFLHTELILDVQVNSYDMDSETYSLQHVPLSPFTVDLQT